MYDRYTLTVKNDELALVLGVEVPDEYRPQFNAAPTRRLPVITSRESQQLSFFYWGLMSRWSNNKTMSPKFFNRPVNSALNRPAYRKQLATHRCVIPMDGFYVWKQVARRQKIPYYFYYPDRRVFSIAGLWEETDDSGSTGASFIMMTRPAASPLADFQEEMPAILEAGAARKWLESDDLSELEELLSHDHPVTLNSHTVSPRIADLELNDGSLTSAAPASDQHGNYTLFT